MRWAVFSDIHSNLEALEAVLAALSKERIDRYFCLGDIVGYGADPAECIARIKALSPVTIAGNHDWACVNLFGDAYFNQVAKDALLWTKRRLTNEDKQFLKDLELVHRDKELTLVHGSLCNPKEFEYILDIYSAEKSFQLLQTKLCFIGHTHHPLVFIKNGESYVYTFQSKIRIKRAEFYIVNTGSVGQPRDGNPDASYVIYDTESKELEIKRVAYNVSQAQDKIIQAGLPKMLAERLVWGR